jgi:hypothetical protein
VSTRQHWVLLKKFVSARWANELTVHVAFELSRVMPILPRLVLIVAV